MAEATSLLKSLSVPEPLRSQLVQKSRLGFMLMLDADGVMELIRFIHILRNHFIFKNILKCPKMSQNVPKYLKMSKHVKRSKSLKNIKKTSKNH